ncbi:MAG: ATP-binding protein [Bacteroidales bacterium]|jgi:hypothetical protein|nr:ATP-binding protein [Bacteroidales bacterium]
MDKAFSFGTTTFGVNFTDREEDAKRLTSNFKNGVNTILVSPRRWGKSSLVQKVADDLNTKRSNIKVISMDAFMCRTEEDFYKMFAAEVIKQTSSRFEEWVRTSKQFLSRLSPKISFGVDPLNDFSLSLDINSDIQSEQDILDLPYKIANEKKLNIVICIDEFQQVSEFQNSKSFQKKLRSIWQTHRNITYCLYGSKMHLLSVMFSKQSMPFYKFGELIFLQKISTENWIKYICSRFTDTGKYISAEIAGEICTAVENHSSYVQQLSMLVWTKTKKNVRNEYLKESIEELIDQNGILFYRETENLTRYQLNFLRALTSGIESEFSRAEIIKKYDLGSSANIVRIKKSLEQKELIDITGKKIIFLDPVFKLWLKREFKIL